MSADDRCCTLRILLLGEGNLSFAHALVKRLSASVYFGRWKAREAVADDVVVNNAMQCAVLATTFDSSSEVTARYPEVVPILNYFASKSRVHVEYAGNVNATDIEGTLTQCGHACYRPHMIFFNNPHIGFEDQYRQGSLISHFFSSVRAMPTSEELNGQGKRLPRQVVLALCDDQPRRWGLMAAAARNGFVCIAATPLLRGDYPEYENKRHQSDARFPYKAMIQYYFMEVTEPMVRELVTNTLPPILEEWPTRGSSDAVPCLRGISVDTRDWSGAVEAALATGLTPVSADCTGCCGGAAVAMPLLHRDLLKACQERQAAAAARFSLRSLEVNACFPLLHPTLLHAASEELHGAGLPKQKVDGREDATRDVRARFSPYIDVRTVGQLYKLQAAIEDVGAASATSDVVNAGVATDEAEVPPTLNPAILGRPLTQRESVKLARYLNRTAAGGKSTAKQGARYLSTSDISTASATDTVLCCPYCHDANDAEGQRRFHSQNGYDHHILTKHSGVVQLHPNMHARVHKQIVPGANSDNLEALMQSQLHIDGAEMEEKSPREDRYCGVCDLLFSTRAAFDEHLLFLSPQASSYVCEVCEVPRRFPDERALQQHIVLKHSQRAT